MRKIAIAFAVVLLTSVFTMGQDSEKGSLFGGYQYMSVGTQHFQRQSMNGWDVDVAGNLHKIAIVGDFSGVYHGNFLGFNGLTAHIYNFLFGPRVYIPLGKAEPFLEAQFGLARVGLSRNGVSNTNSNFGLAVGGGLDLNIKQHFGIRAFKLDYILDRTPLNFLGITNNTNNLRLATGVKYRF